MGKDKHVWHLEGWGSAGDDTESAREVGSRSQTRVGLLKGLVLWEDIESPKHLYSTI